MHRSFNAAIVVLFAFNVAFAQTPPDYVFQSAIYADADDGSPTATYTNTSWSWTATPGGAGWSGEKELSGSVSSGSVTSTTSEFLDVDPTTGRIIFDTMQKITVFVRTPGSYNVATSTSAETEVNAPQAIQAVHTASVGTYPFGQALTARVSYSENTPNQSYSGSPSEVRSIACNPSPVVFNSTHYYKLYEYSVEAGIDLQGHGAEDGLAEATTTITPTPVSYGAPTAELDGPYIAGQVPTIIFKNSTVTYHDKSYDPDNGSTTPGTGICSRLISITRYGANVCSGSGSTLNCLVTLPGKYDITLTVTDDEGVQDQDTDSFTVPPHDVIRTGDCPAPESGGQCLDTIAPRCPVDSEGTGNSSTSTSSGLGTDIDGETTVQVSVNPGTASGGAYLYDPVATRGYPLTNNIRINTLQRFPSLTTPMGNAFFTYGIFITPQSVPVQGGTQQRWFLIDADGAEYDYGPVNGALTPEGGVHGVLAQDQSLNFTLTGAGAPGSIFEAGNFTYQFNSFGQLLSITDPSGNVQEINYNTSGYPENVGDLSSNRSISFEYDTPGYIARVVEGGGEVVTHFGYTSGKLTSAEIKDAIGNTIRSVAITYTGNGRLYQITKDGDSDTTMTFSYVYSGIPGVEFANLSWANGGTNFDYFATPGTGAAYRVNRLNAFGGTISYDYDATGNLLKITYPPLKSQSSPTVFTFGYDSNKNLTSWSDGTGTFTLGYNLLGLLTSFSNGVGGSWAYGYSGADPTSASDTTGTLYTISYTDSSNPHSPTSVTDAASNSWGATYNQFGQPLTVTPPTGSPSGTLTLAYEETSSSPMYGYLKSITNVEGDVETYDSYSPLGQVSSLSTSPSGGVTNTSTYDYDAAQRLLEVTHPDSKTVEYDYSGWELASIIDEAGTSTDLTHCPSCGKLTGVSLPLSKALSWNLNGDFAVTSLFDGRNNQTTYTYGTAGELQEITFPDSLKYKFEYFRTGLTRTFLIGSSVKQKFEYDNARRLSNVKLGTSSTPAISYTYNTDGSVQQIVDQVGTRTYSYTTSRMVEIVTYDFTANGFSTQQFVDYDYNPDGSVSMITWRSGTTTIASWDYDYDGAGRLISISNSFGESVSYSYDGEGKITVQTNSNGTTVEYEYIEARNWLASIAHKHSGTPFASYDLEYDEGANTVGNLTEVTELDGAVVTYDYDALYRLTSEVRTGSNAYSRSYGYDLAGNVTTLNGSTFASYDAGNKFSSLSGGSYSYDADGNLRSASYSGFTYGTASFDQRQKLISLSPKTFGYTSEGLRGFVRPTSTSPRTFYIFAGNQVVGEINSSGAQMAYTWGADGLLSQRVLTGTPKSLWYHFGPQGETRQLTDSSGLVADTYRYTAYGSLLGSTGGDANYHRYGGRYGYYTDTTVSAVLAGQRWYQPGLMRWLSRDLSLYDGGDNPYVYVENQPVDWIDPEGLARRRGKTPPKLWPVPPPNVVGKNPKWDPDGYWKKGKGGQADVVWDPTGHGGGGHWDEDEPGKKKRGQGRRWDKNGRLLPMVDGCEKEMDDGEAETVHWAEYLAIIAAGSRAAPLMPLIPRFGPRIAPMIPRLTPSVP